MKTLKRTIWILPVALILSSCYSTRELFNHEEPTVISKKEIAVNNVNVDDLVTVVINERQFPNLKVLAVTDSMMVVKSWKYKSPDGQYYLYYDYIQDLTLHQFDATYSVGGPFIVLLVAFYALGGA